MTASTASTTAIVTTIVHDRLVKRQLDAKLTATADLQQIGLTSFDIISILLGVEQSFAIEFQDHEISPTNFSTIESIARLTEQVLNRKA